MIKPILLFVVGLICLIKGGDWFVDGASSLARKFQLPELLIEPLRRHDRGDPAHLLASGHASHSVAYSRHNGRSAALLEGLDHQRILIHASGRSDISTISI